MRIPTTGPLNSPDAPGFSAPGLKDAVAQSRNTGLPIFDAKTATDLLSRTPDAAHRESLINLANDPASFVKAHFSLTDKQIKNVDNMSNAETIALRKGAQTALRENLALQAECGRPDVLEQVVAEAEHFSLTKTAAPANSELAASGFSGTLTVHMQGFEE